MRRRPAAASSSSSAAELKNSLAGTADNAHDAGAAAVQSGLEVAHNSSLWGVQTKDLLHEMTFDYARGAHELAAALRAVKEAVDAMPPRNGVTRSAVDPRFMCAFLRREKEGGEVALDFAPPAAVDVVGSYLLRTQVRGNGGGNSNVPAVDLALEIPDACLDAKDYLNNRCVRVRACVRACVQRAGMRRAGMRASLCCIV
jgi:hypothetical protein